MMRMEFSFHPIEGWPFRQRVDCMPGGEMPAIYLLPGVKYEFSTFGGPHVGVVPGENRAFFRTMFWWARPAVFDGSWLTHACYWPAEIRFFEGRSSADADDRAQEYIRGRMEGTLWPRT